MNLVQRLAHIALGGVLVATGLIIGLSFSSQATPTGEFDVIECKGLRIVDDTGNTMIRFSSFPVGGFVEESVNRYNDEGSSSGLPTSLAPTLGGEITIFGNDEKAKVVLRVNTDGGQLKVWSNDGRKPKVIMGINKYGNGDVSTWNKNGYLQVDSH